MGRKKQILLENPKAIVETVDLLENNKASTKKIIDYFIKEETVKFNPNESVEKVESHISEFDRILYSEISTIVYQIDEHELTNLQSNLERCINDNNLTKNSKKIFVKIWDHVNLANKQIENLKDSDDTLKKRVEPKLYEIINPKIEGLKEGIYTQLISIVGIFVAIAFVMFGGMSLLNGLFNFNNMESIPLKELMLLGSLFGCVIIIVLYFFTRLILLLVFQNADKIKNNVKEINEILLVGIIVIFLVMFISICIVCFLTPK